MLSLLRSGRRVDLIVEDLRSNLCGSLGPAIASDVRALMAADPHALRPLVDDPLDPVKSAFNFEAWRLHHCLHCHVFFRRNSAPLLFQSIHSLALFRLAHPVIFCSTEGDYLQLYLSSGT